MDTIRGAYLARGSDEGRTNHDFIEKLKTELLYNGGRRCEFCIPRKGGHA